MRPRLALLLVALAGLPAGCLSLFPEDDAPRRVEGPTRGYSPTAAYLKVHVETPEGRMLVDFDRRDWHVAELARRLDDRRIDFLAAEGETRLMGEVVARSVHDPADLATLRYSEMRLREEDRLRLDAEYDEILARAAAAGEAALDAAPQAAPEPALPGLA